jgi:MFS family permease
LRQLEQARRLSPREALQIIPQICDALQYAHDEGVVHRDIKPENVLVDRRGRVKIADFGLAKILGTDPGAARLTAEGQVMGTPHYMAPEQVERPLAVDHRADIYSLGVVFYELLTGDLPLGKFPPPSRKVQVDVRLDEVVLRALENDPERRYQQASEVKSRVETIAETPPPATSASPPPPLEPQFIRWAGFRLVKIRDGTRAVHWKGTLQAWAILFAVLTIAFGVVSVVAGQSLFGWLGVVGWPGVLARLVLSGLAVVFGVGRAMRQPLRPEPADALPRTPQGTLILPSGGLAHAEAGSLSPSELERIREQVRRPAMGLLVTGILNWVLVPLAFLLILWIVPGARIEAISLDRSNASLAALGLGILALCSFIIAASLKMRRLEWYWRASVAAVLAVIVSPGNIIGLPIGIWALSVLLRREVREAFRARSRQEPSPKEWWWSTTRGGVTLAALCVAVIGLVAGRHSQPGDFKIPAQQVAQRDAQTGRLVAKLPGRGTVELLAIGEAHGPPNGWWAPDGTPLANVFYEVRAGVHKVMGNRVPKEFLFRATDLPDGASFVGIEADPVSGGGSGGEVFLDGRRIRGGWPARLAWEPSVRAASLYLGYGLETWRTIATHDAKFQSHLQQRNAGDPNWVVNLHHAPTDTKEGAQIAVVFGPEDRLWQHRMVAVDTNDVEHPVSQGHGTPIERLMLWTYTFHQLPLVAAKEFRFQVRPVHWIEFPDVALAPRAPLPPPKYQPFGPGLERSLNEAADFDRGKVATANAPAVTRDPVPQAATFGPAREQTFTGFIDFDTGATAGLPEDDEAFNPFEITPSLLDWMQQNGLDAHASAGKLETLGVGIVDLADGDWDSLKPDELASRLQTSGRFQIELRPDADGGSPATFGFRTREGGAGMLQLVAFGGPKVGATVRYKLVKKPGPGG